MTFHVFQIRRSTGSELFLSRSFSTVWELCLIPYDILLFKITIDDDLCDVYTGFLVNTTAHNTVLTSPMIMEATTVRHDEKVKFESCRVDFQKVRTISVSNFLSRLSLLEILVYFSNSKIRVNRKLPIYSFATYCFLTGKKMTTEEEEVKEVLSVREILLKQRIRQECLKDKTRKITLKLISIYIHRSKWRMYTAYLEIWWDSADLTEDVDMSRSKKESHDTYMSRSQIMKTLPK